jgi:hypothetical protein
MTDSSNNIDAIHDHLKRIEKLTQDRGRIMAMAPEQALNKILEHPQPNALMHSFSEEDFFFLVHHIGPEDALEVLALASDRQWEYVIDMESWAKDRINLNAVTHWLNLLLQADPTRFTRWAMTEKPELVEYYMFKTCEVQIREHDQDPSEIGDDYITFDDIFYVKIPSASEETGDEAGEREKQNAFLTQMLSRLSDADHVLYQQTLLRSANVIPAESEEEFYRFRNVRLAEKGFQPFDEAVGIYQPIAAKEIRKRKKALPKTKNLDAFVPVPLHHHALMEKDNIFSRALSKISLEDAFEQIQIEFAGLCNRITSADQKPVYEREELRAIVKKACGYLSIGLERLAGNHPILDENKMAGLIKTYPLEDIFKAGYSPVAILAQKAKSWREKSWFTANRLALSFWGEDLVGVIGGLLIHRPKFFDNYKTGVLYREFETLADVKQTRFALKEAMAFDDLLSRMSIDTNFFHKEFFITHKNLLLTLWARHGIGLSYEPKPIEIKDFKRFYNGLWGKTGSGVFVKEERKTDFLHWLAKQSRLSEVEISKNLGRAMERLFEEIVTEYGNVKFKDLDPRFVQLFMISPSSPLSD